MKEENTDGFSSITMDPPRLVWALVALVLALVCFWLVSQIAPLVYLVTVAALWLFHYYCPGHLDAITARLYDFPPPLRANVDIPGGATIAQPNGRGRLRIR